MGQALYSPRFRASHTFWKTLIAPSRPDVPRPGIVGMRGSMVIRLRPCMIMSAPPRATLDFSVWRSEFFTRLEKPGSLGYREGRPKSTRSGMYTTCAGSMPINIIIILCTPRTDDLYDLYDLYVLFPHQDLDISRQICSRFYSTCTTVAYVAGWHRYNLQWSIVANVFLLGSASSIVANVSWVRICMIYRGKCFLG